MEDGNIYAAITDDNGDEHEVEIPVRLHLLLNVDLQDVNVGITIDALSAHGAYRLEVTVDQYCLCIDCMSKAVYAGHEHVSVPIIMICMSPAQVVL